MSGRTACTDALCSWDLVKKGRLLSGETERDAPRSQTHFHIEHLGALAFSVLALFWLRLSLIFIDFSFSFQDGLDRVVEDGASPLHPGHIANTGLHLTEGSWVGLAERDVDGRSLAWPELGLVVRTPSRAAATEAGS
ncbi:uncharacterized protein SPSK_09933 [Sporothrix schenckii 1099-18]|uniref:Uncharacterized protein n=1 Tax=Sporothrix schenckii 1099-18 TaxID=1397361 RepID=A0A0F2M887_SPOSC|nr:uncharacterized protein SPSK_09933 [Sporothrix schenckii 1099-18]KJR85908.1 hypothetical protein SPSK_09933 [Sporothrix schenckii 1099-18]